MLASAVCEPRSPHLDPETCGAVSLELLAISDFSVGLPNARGFMLIRKVATPLLLLFASACMQRLDLAVPALVRISGTRGGTSIRGTGFIVGLDRGKATIATASHVIENVQELEVTFAVNPALSFPAGAVLGLDAGSPNGLAAFQVSGELPEGATALSFDVGRTPQLGEALFLLGFPQMELAPRITQRVLAARRGTLLLVDQEVGEGFSGGPVLKEGKVVGVVTESDGQTTYAVNSVVALGSLQGWGLKFPVHSNPPPLSVPQLQMQIQQMQPSSNRY